MKTATYIIVTMLATAAAAAGISHTSSNVVMIYPTNVTMGAIESKYIAGGCLTNEFVSRVTPSFASTVYGLADALFQRNIYTRLAEYQDGLKLDSLSSLKSMDLSTTTNFCLGSFPYGDAVAYLSKVNRCFTNVSSRIGFHPFSEIVDYVSGDASSYFNVMQLLTNDSRFSCWTASEEFGVHDMGWSSSAIQGNILTISSDTTKPTMGEVIRPYMNSYAICLSELPNSLKGLYGRSQPSDHFLSGMSIPHDESDTEFLQWIERKSNINSNYVDLASLVDSCGWGLASFTNRPTDRLSGRRYALANAAMSLADTTIGNWGSYAPQLDTCQKSFRESGINTITAQCRDSTVELEISNGIATLHIPEISIGSTQEDYSCTVTTNSGYSGTAVKRTVTKTAEMFAYNFQTIPLTPNDLSEIVTAAYYDCPCFPCRFNVTYDYNNSWVGYARVVSIECADYPVSQRLLVQSIDGTYTLTCSSYGILNIHGEILRSARNSIVFNPQDDPLSNPSNAIPARWPHHLAPVTDIYVTRFFEQRKSNGMTQVENMLNGSESDVLTGTPKYGAQCFNAARNELDAKMLNLYQMITLQDEREVMRVIDLPINMQELCSASTQLIGQWIKDMLTEREASISFGSPHLMIYFDESGNPKVTDLEDQSIEYDTTEPIYGSINLNISSSEGPSTEGSSASSKSTYSDVIAVKWDFPAMKRTDSGQ